MDYIDELIRILPYTKQYNIQLILLLLAAYHSVNLTETMYRNKYHLFAAAVLFPRKRSVALSQDSYNLYLSV